MPGGKTVRYPAPPAGMGLRNLAVLNAELEGSMGMILPGVGLLSSGNLCMPSLLNNLVFGSVRSAKGFLQNKYWQLFKTDPEFVSTNHTMI